MYIYFINNRKRKNTNKEKRQGRAALLGSITPQALVGQGHVQVQGEVGAWEDGGHRPPHRCSVSGHQGFQAHFLEGRCGFDAEEAYSSMEDVSAGLIHMLQCSLRSAPVLDPASFLEPLECQESSSLTSAPTLPACI